MAGLFDSLTGGDPVLAATIAQQQRQQAQMQNAVGQFADPWGKVGAAAGSLLGQIGGRYVADKLGYVSPEMQAAQRQAQVIKALQGADLTTEEGLRAAARQARELGDDTTALRLFAKAGEAKLSAAKLAREQSESELKARQKVIDQLPTESRMAMVVEDPSFLLQANPNMTEEQAAAIREKTQGALQFRMAEAAKKAADLKDVKQTDVSATDVKQREADLRTMGIGPHSFEWGLGFDSKESFGDFASVWANKMQAALDRLGRQQVRIDAKAFGDRVVKAGLAEGSITGKYGKDITDIDEGRLDDLIKAQEAALLGEVAPVRQDVSTTQRAPQTGRRVIPYNPQR